MGEPKGPGHARFSCSLTLGQSDLVGAHRGPPGKLLSLDVRLASELAEIDRDLIYEATALPGFRDAVLAASGRGIVAKMEQLSGAFLAVILLHGFDPPG
ncbi:MAG: hypothetical protein QOF13_880 [Solirubrobacterales bacterium]|jgi:hypothetical protein|nr:hypothetical protein [Solirubrobacterales bacterium]